MRLSGSHLTPQWFALKFALNLAEAQKSVIFSNANGLSALANTGGHIAVTDVFGQYGHSRSVPSP